MPDAKGEARSDLVRMLRHELRTPVNHIVGYSELLLESAEDLPHGPRDLTPDLRKIAGAGKHLLWLIDVLLSPSPDEPVSTEWDLRRACYELRASLTTVIGYSELLVDEVKETRQRQLVPDLQRIGGAGAHLLGLVDTVLRLTLSETTTRAGLLLPSGLPLVTQEPTPVLARAEALLERGRVLVVEDDALSRDMLARRVARLGYIVSVAENGRQALERIQDEPIDVLLLDILMPEMDGFQVLRHLKADSALRHLPVIVLSASATDEDAVRCIELGADDYLPKPFDPVLLRARIGACLERKRFRDQEERYLRRIEEEQKRSDDLLHVILPDQIVNELKATNTVQPRRYENVAVLFCDIAGFTPYCDTHQPEEVVSHLQALVERYEESALRHGMQKIKTIGDAFMAVAGLLRPVDSPVLASIQCALEMIEVTKRFPPHWTIRAGIHVGPVVAGVIGSRQYLFDLWGDTVNIAARMESHGTPGAIALSRAAWDQVCDRCTAESHGLVSIKGKGEQEVFFVTDSAAGQLVDNSGEYLTHRNGPSR